FQAEDGIRDFHVTGVQTCALPIWADGLPSCRLPLLAGAAIPDRCQRLGERHTVGLGERPRLIPQSILVAGHGFRQSVYFDVVPEIGRASGRSTGRLWDEAVDTRRE